MFEKDESSVSPNEEEEEKEETRKEMSSRRRQYNTTGKKDLVKINTKKSTKKRNLFPELSFVEKHVDTFYIGLNDQWQAAAYNPVQAKMLNKADQVVKDWVS